MLFAILNRGLNPTTGGQKSSRGRVGSSQPEASVRIKLAKLRETEYQCDHLDWRSRERQAESPCPALPGKLTSSPSVSARKSAAGTEVIRYGHRKFTPLQKSAS